ncbi:FAD-dependent oxidoreductase [Sneathiella litorea]|uniref:Tryptophan 2-monooxygenase n=1 Tax=Sneathiella litorea TaxID=2606216 RepID=A0A6L8W3G3_9PROT|nr:FAD-dependent oxidoreductase [Sneathiella litorea]MZR29538.1 NAD(P)-binding protein [Sneathiella litorea]
MSERKEEVSESGRSSESGLTLATGRSTSKAWCATYPGPADRNFNYRKLLDSSKSGIGDASESPIKVAIIGAGPAGLTAAHELARSGLKNIHLYEASNRYGGRFWTKTLAPDYGEEQFSAMDAGAMRMPPFIDETKKKDNPTLSERRAEILSGCSILSYYLNKFQISTGEFPNPGSRIAKTGIYYNEGSLKPDTKEEAKEEGAETRSRDYQETNSNGKGTMLIWHEDQDDPPNEKLRNVKKKWDDWGNKVKQQVRKAYPTPEWPVFWKKIVANYYDKTFRDVVFLPTVDDEGEHKKGNFGGLGMTEEEARIFYVIGAGDGGWGSFFNLSFLYVYRTFIHGFGTDLQVIEGLFDEEGNRLSGPGQNTYVYDSLSGQIATPNYLGTSTITECLLFGPIGGKSKTPALYGKHLEGALSQEPGGNGLHLFFDSPVSKIEKLSNGKVKLHVKYGIDKSLNFNFEAQEYDAVIITVPTHQFGTEIEVSGFNPETEWPYDLQAYLAQAHWEPCVKVFVELNQAYWEDPKCPIPQIIESETFIRDTYGVKINKGTKDKQTGILLLSYTWWRDATKLVGYDDQELINLAVKEADRMLDNCKNMGGHKISNYVKHTKDQFGNINYKGWVHHWELQKNFKGAARLYDQRTWKSTQTPMMYNQHYSKNSKLYFAGEGYHVDAGWVEPAFRTAIDSVLRIFLHNEIKIITENFDFNRDYPEYDPNFDPATHKVE